MEEAARAVGEEESLGETINGGRGDTRPIADARSHLLEKRNDGSPESCSGKP
jgi:hypothetical protein